MNNSRNDLFLWPQQVEICRFGCPDHCQSPAEYVAREQLEVSTSLNNKRQISPNPSLRNPFLSGPPQPQYTRQTYQQQRSRADRIPPPPPAPARQLPNPLPLQAKDIPPPPPAPLQRRHQQVESEDEARKAPGGGLFGDLLPSLPKLPSLPSFPNFFGGSTKPENKRKAESPSNKGEAIKISLGPSPKIEVLITFKPNGQWTCSNGHYFWMWFLIFSGVTCNYILPEKIVKFPENLDS